MKRINLLYAAVLVMQYGNSIGVTGIPLVAQFHFDCSFWTLTLIGVSGPLTYTVSCLVLASSVGRVKPVNMMIAGIFTFPAVYVAAAFVTAAWHLIVIAAVQSVMASLFWPMMEIVLAERVAGPALSRRMGNFNIGWSLGDAFGAATAGALYKLWPFAPFIAVPVLSLPVFFIIRAAFRRAADLTENANGSSAPDEHAPERITDAWRRAGLIANFFGFGVTGVIRSVFAAAASKVFFMSGPLYSLVIAVFNALRTLTFVVLGHWHGWHYRKRHFLALNSLLAVGMVGTLCAAFVPSWLAVPLVFVSFAAAGVGVGMTYTASIFYSLSAAKIENAKAHLHEAVLGGGAALFTAASGAAIALARPSLLDRANLAPLPACVVAVFLGMALSARCLRSSPKPLEDAP